MQLPWHLVPQLSAQGKGKGKGKGVPLSSLIEKDLLTFFHFNLYFC